MIVSMTVAVRTCERCGYENGPTRDLFCGGCGNRRPVWKFRDASSVHSTTTETGW